MSIAIIPFIEPSSPPRNIVRMVGIGSDEPKLSTVSLTRSLFMVQEYLTGGSLKRIVMEQMLDWNVSDVCLH